MAHPFSMPWPPQWQVPTQWPFWTPWAFDQAQWPDSGWSLSMALESRYHQTRLETLSQPDTDTSTEHDLEPRHNTNCGTGNGIEL